MKNLLIFLNLAAKAIRSIPQYKQLGGLVKKARKTKISAAEVSQMKSMFEELQKDKILKEFKKSDDAKLKHLKLIIREILKRLP